MQAAREAKVTFQVGAGLAESVQGVRHQRYLNRPGFPNSGHLVRSDVRMKHSPCIRRLLGNQMKQIQSTTAVLCVWLMAAAPIWAQQDRPPEDTTPRLSSD